MIAPFDTKRYAEDWKACGKDGCDEGWVPQVVKRQVHRFVGQWSSTSPGSDDGYFAHPTTGARMKYHHANGGNDPDFEFVEVEETDWVHCPCHPNHWSRRQ